MYNSMRDNRRSRLKETCMTAEESTSPEPITTEKPAGTTAAVRRDLLAELAAAIGENAIIEGDKLIVERGEAVALYIYVQPDGSFTLIKWMTTATPTGHPRWREAADLILQPGEAIYTSALGGGFLIEIEQHTPTVAAAVKLANDPTAAQRIQSLATEFPEAIGLLEPEDVPDYLLPERENS
jgi:hypothetical protein